MTSPQMNLGTSCPRHTRSFVLQSGRRPLLGLLFVLLAFPIPVLGQGMGVVYFRSTSSAYGPSYKVNGDGTGASLLTTSPEDVNRPTARADYPGGPLFSWRQTTGTISTADGLLTFR